MKDLETLNNLAYIPYDLPKKLCNSCKYVESTLFYKFCIKDANNKIMLEEAASKNFINESCPFYKTNFVTKIKNIFKKF